MTEEELLSLLLPDPVEIMSNSAEAMTNIDWSFMNDLEPWPFANSSLHVPLLPNLFSEKQVSERFNVTLRTVRDRSRLLGLGRKLSGVRWLTEAEILSLMEGETLKCSSYPKGTTANSGPRVARTVASSLTEALKLLKNERPRPSSNASKKKSSSRQVVAFKKKQGQPLLKR